MLRESYAGRHGPCVVERLDRDMDALTKVAVTDDADLELELEMWDWARAAGLSADELRQALIALLPPILRQAA